jgi:hypothetical protein
MNRIRVIDDNYQVLITPTIKISPDSSLEIGNWTDENLRNYHVINYKSKNDAEFNALKYPDIDWNRIIINHEEIYYRLRSTIKSILDQYSYDVEYNPMFMSSYQLKNSMFDRVINGGDRFNLRYYQSDIINIVIVNPWFKILESISNVLEKYRDHLYSDVLRIRDKKIVDNKIIILYGVTELGTTYQIKLIPSILNQWSNWMNKYNNVVKGEELYRKMLYTQSIIDSTPAIR